MASKKVNLDFLEGSAATVAQRLLGCVLERHVDGQVLSGRIVETEAYDETDVASHSYNGRTPRVEVMFGPAGYLYVYFTYGMHYCCNVVVGEEGHGAAVLIRALEPIEGIETMRHRRGRIGKELTNGPAKLCQALAIGKGQNGANLSTGSVRLIPKAALPTAKITITTRVGITRGVDVPWRFYITDNPFVSRPIK